MQGFVTSYAQQAGGSLAHSHNIMKCFTPGPKPECKIPVLMTLAAEYAVCDRWFASIPGPTLPNRCYAHCATSVGRLDMNPIWFDASKTIYELLAESKVTSKIYYHDVTMVETFANFLKNQNYFGTIDDFLEACSSGRLPTYSFIEPRYNADNTNHLAANDQHPDHDVAEGETLTQDVYNAVRKSKLWENTVLLIVYDEHGGIFDHVPPPAAVNPDAKNCINPSFDFSRLGVRVPAVVVSPWIPAGTIDHTQYDHSSIAATARKLFLSSDVEPLTHRDAIANTFEGNLTLAAARTDQISFNAIEKNAALARAADPAQVQARTAQHAALPLSDLQKALVQQTNFVNQHALPPAQRSATTPEQVQTEQQAADFHAQVMSQTLPPKTGTAGSSGTGAPQ